METETQYVPVGWSSRASGANYFKDTQRHLRINDDAVYDVRTLCGVKVPPKVLGPQRRDTGLFNRLSPLDGVDLERAKPCARCYRKASSARG